MVEGGLIRLLIMNGEEESCPAVVLVVNGEKVSILVPESKLQDWTDAPDWHVIVPPIVIWGGR
jgi:hypothetical protein